MEPEPRTTTTILRSTNKCYLLETPHSCSMYSCDPPCHNVVMSCLNAAMLSDTNMVGILRAYHPKILEELQQALHRFSFLLSSIILFIQFVSSNARHYKLYSRGAIGNMLKQLKEPLTNQRSCHLYFASTPQQCDLWMLC